MQGVRVKTRTIVSRPAGGHDSHGGSWDAGLTLLLAVADKQGTQEILSKYLPIRAMTIRRQI